MSMTTAMAMTMTMNLTMAMTMAMGSITFSVIRLTCNSRKILVIMMANITIMFNSVML